jgi:hypothetical protein
MIAGGKNGIKDIAGRATHLRPSPRDFGGQALPDEAPQSGAQSGVPVARLASRVLPCGQSRGLTYRTVTKAERASPQRQTVPSDCRHGDTHRPTEALDRVYPQLRWLCAARLQAVLAKSRSSFHSPYNRIISSRTTSKNSPGARVRSTTSSLYGHSFHITLLLISFLNQSNPNGQKSTLYRDLVTQTGDTS